MIYVGNAIYANAGGKWIRSKMTAQDMLNRSRKIFATQERNSAAMFATNR